MVSHVKPVVVLKKSFGVNHSSHRSLLRQGRSVQDSGSRTNEVILIRREDGLFSRYRPCLQMFPARYRGAL